MAVIPRVHPLTREAVPPEVEMMVLLSTATLLICESNMTVIATVLGVVVSFGIKVPSSFQVPERLVNSG